MLRQIPIYVNASTGKQISASGSSISNASYPSVYIGEEIIFCLTFTDSNSNPYEFLASETFQLTINNSYYSSTNTPMAFSNNDYFNVPGDWTSVAPTSGMISARVNCNSSSFSTKLGTSASLNCMIEIQKMSGGSPAVIWQGVIVCNNVLTQTGASQPDNPQTFYNSNQSDSRYMQMSNFAIVQPTAVAVVGGVITKTGSQHQVSATTNTDINTISGGYAGQILVLYHSTTYIVTLKHGTGNLIMPSHSDLVMAQDACYTLFFDGTSWRAVV